MNLLFPFHCWEYTEPKLGMLTSVNQVHSFCLFQEFSYSVVHLFRCCRCIVPQNIPTELIVSYYEFETES